MLLKKVYINLVSILVLLLVISIPAIGQKDYKVKKISFEGNKTLKNAELKANINTKAKTLTGKLKFWVKAPRFSGKVLNQDIERLLRLYQRNGFLTPDIEYKLNQNDSTKSVRVAIKINEGESVLLNHMSLDITKEAEYHPSLTDRDKERPIKEGERFQDKKVKAFELYIQQKYSDRGYPFSTVKDQVTLQPGNKKADIIFQIDPGAKCFFGHTWIKSDSLVPESFIRNQLKYSEGELFSKELVSKSQQKLYDTELFQYVVIRTLLDSIKEGHVPMSVQVKEKPRWSLITGVGYGSEDRFRLSAQVTRRQFFGGARKLIFTGKRSYYLPVSLELSFIQPDIFKDNLDFILNPYFIWENETSYEVKRLGSGITLKNDFNKHTSAYLMYTFEKDWFSYKSDPVEVNKQDSLPYNKSLLYQGERNKL